MPIEPDSTFIVATEVKNMRNKFWVFIVALVFSACSSITPITGSGNVHTEERTVQNVVAVNLATVGTLVIQQGQAESLFVEADDNILPLIVTGVKDGTLTIDSSRSFSKPTSLTYTLTVLEINAITLSGAGTINAENLSADVISLENSGSGSLALGDLVITSGADMVNSGSGNTTLRSLTSADTSFTISGSGGLEIDALVATTLKAELTGAGNATLSGQATSQNVTVSGNGSYNAENLVTSSATATTTGSGSITVNASESLNATVSGSGSVIYIGSPTLTQQDNGAGEIKPK